MLYSNKIKPYSFVNPNLISVPRSGMASAVKSGGGVATTFAQSSRKTLLGLNRLGASLQSLGETQKQIRDVLSVQLKTSKDVKSFKLKRKQYLRDQESERKTELAGQRKGEVVDKEEVKKEGEKKLSWLEKLLGPFKGIVEFALRTIITQGILRWLSDPKNGERLHKVVTGLSKFFGFVFGIVSWSIGSFMSGVSNVFGDDSKGGLSRFAEVLGGLGQILVGIAGLKAASYLLNPFSLISDVLGLVDLLSSRDTSGGADVPTDKPGKGAKPSVGPQRNALTKFGRKAFVGVLGKGGAKSALTFFKKTVSPVLKKIPIIGGLIDFAINVFVFKESPGKAAFKAIGAGLLTWLGGAIGSVIPGPGTFVGALLGGMAGDALGGLLYDAIFGKGKKDDEPALAEGGLITKPTRAIVGERGPELILPLGLLSSVSGAGPIVSTIASALTGALSAMGSSGELAKQVVSDDLAEMQKQSDGVRQAQPGESLGKSVIKTSGGLSELELGSGSDGMNQYIGDKSSYGKKSPRNTLRGALANILGVFESISKKSFSTGSGGFGGGGGGGSSGSEGDLGPVEEIKPGPMHQKGAQIAKNLMRLLGIKDYQAAGIVGNLIQESALVPDRIQGKPPSQGGPLKLDGRTGYSYPQWTSIDRQTNFAKYMESKGFDWRNRGATDEMATGFLAKEFKSYMSSVFKNTKDAAAASNWVLFNYEKPADQGPAEQKERAADAQAVLAKMAAGGRLENDTAFARRENKNIIQVQLDKGKKLKKYASGGSHRTVPNTSSTSWAAGIPLTYIRSKEGKTAEVAAPLASRFQGFINELQKTGYKITEMGGFRPDGPPAGNVDGKGPLYSHPYGAAIDINWSKNPAFRKAPHNFPPNSGEIAAKYGLGWGIKFDDAMHFSAMKREYGKGIGGKEISRKTLMGSKYEELVTDDKDQKDSSSVSSTPPDTEDTEKTPEEQFRSIIEKMTSDILSLSGVSKPTSEDEKKKTSPITSATKPTIVPAEPKPKTSSPAAVSAAVSQTTGENIEKLSATAAALEEDNNKRLSLVPVPTAINSGSAAAPVAQPPVVRPRTPITYGF